MQQFDPFESLDSPSPGEDEFVLIQEQVDKLVNKYETRALSLLVGMALSALSAAMHLRDPGRCERAGGCQHKQEMAGELLHVLGSGKSLGFLAEAEIATLASSAVLALAIMAPDESEQPSTPQGVLDVLGSEFSPIEDNEEGWEETRRSIRDGFEMQALAIQLRGLATTEEPGFEF